LALPLPKLIVFAWLVGGADTTTCDSEGMNEWFAQISPEVKFQASVLGQFSQVSSF